MKLCCFFCGRPTLLDTFAGSGGAGEGWRRAGFCVTAVDNNAARIAMYPEPDCLGARRIVDDAIQFILRFGDIFAVKHGSPTCTGYSQGTAMLPDRLEKYERLIGVTRAAFEEVGGIYVIENVVSKDTRAELIDPTMLCWTEFYEPGSVLDTHECEHCESGVPLWARRHRLFESNVPLMRAGGCRHPKAMQCAGGYGAARRCPWEAKHIRKGGYVPADVNVLRELLDIDWMDEAGLLLSIPPAYTQHIGEQLMAHLGAEVAA